MFITHYLIATLQMNLVDWFKVMVASRRGEELVDSLIEVHPPPRALKRALLVCLRCIDLDPLKRPKMGQVVHMLEAEDFPFRSVSPLLIFNAFTFEYSLSIFFHVLCILVDKYTTSIIKCSLHMAHC